MAEHVKVKVAQSDISNHLQVKVPSSSADLITAKNKLFLTSREKIFKLKTNLTANCRLYAKIKSDKP